VKRYPAYDPPEYVEWAPSRELGEEFEHRIHVDPERRAIIEALTPGELLELYRGLLTARLHDIMLARWVKQGVLSKAWLGTGEEAVTVGVVHALRRGESGDVVGPMIRNAGACHQMGMPLADMFRAYLATEDSPSHGRDLHVGDLQHGVVAPVSPVGSLVNVINGIALAFRYRGEDRVAATWVGDGATKTGEVHEALNFAAVGKLPVVVILQNNQVALGTRLSQHHRASGFDGWGVAYGVPLLTADGNNVLDVVAAAVLAVRRCRTGGGPVFIAAETFRMGGHATHDVREARETFARSLFEYWGRRDPIGMFEEHLALRPIELGGGEGATCEVRNRATLARIESEVLAAVEESAAAALESREARMPAPASAATGCYAEEE